MSRNEVGAHMGHMKWTFLGAASLGSRATGEVVPRRPSRLLHRGIDRGVPPAIVAPGAGLVESESDVCTGPHQRARNI